MSLGFSLLLCVLFLLFTFNRGLILQCVDDIFRGLIFSVACSSGHCFCLVHPILAQGIHIYTTVSHYIVHLFSVSGFRHNKKELKRSASLSAVQVHRRIVDHSHFFMVYVGVDSDVCPCRTHIFPLAIFFRRKTKIHL